MDVFTWSVPFVGEKVTEMLGHILNVSSGDEFGSQESQDIPPDRRDIIRNKILAVGRMSKFFTVLREESISVIKLKGLSPNGTLPPGLLTEGKDSLSDALKNYSPDTQLVATFDQAREFDLLNERCPPRPDSPEQSQ